MRISDWSSDVCSSDLFSVEAAQAAIRPKDRYHPQTRMIAVEQTANMGGGAIWSLDDIEALGELAARQGRAYHMDGARLLNAVVASGVAASRLATPFDRLGYVRDKGQHGRAACEGMRGQDG